MVIYSGFTQLENGGSFHSYVTVYQLNIMFQCISHLIQWKKHQFPTKSPLVGCTPSAYPKSQRWLVYVGLYSHMSGQTHMLVSQLCKKRVIIATDWWFQPLRKILVSWEYYSQYMEK